PLSSARCQARWRSLSAATQIHPSRSRSPQPMAVQYSYVMKGLTKTFPGAAKPVLNNIHLQFLPDAKIAITGPNGSGKSTLMKIMGGIDPDFTGEAWAADGIKVGYLPQEPQLDPTKTVLENVKMGAGPIAQMVERYRNRRDHGRSARGLRL
ncbi:ATP-binding cassette domain-containing protein, partial [Klebsiella pneumoniae]|uniref:ATP-binding cassette domain-containing protein n=1 Tax=Klebsiella pneumoniae TaxID=573 RepID=UPI0023B1912F